MRLTLLANVSAVLAFGISGTAPAAARVGPGWSQGPLIATPAWLAGHLSDSNLVVLHVGTADEYRSAHIPGARLVRLSDLSVPHPSSPGVTLELPPAGDLRAGLEGLGISDDSTIVVYHGSNWLTPATRVVFTLTAAGLGERTRLLEGGMPAWIRERYPTTTDVRPLRVGALSPRELLPIVVDAAFVQARDSGSNIAVVDARASAFYDGDVLVRRDSPRRGHISGALNVPYASLFDGAGALRPIGELEQIFARAGVRPDATVVAYCHAGMQATAVWFAARLLGHRVLLYDGSMEDWALLRDLPLETSKKGSGTW